MCRSVGFKKDLRLSKKNNYSNYNNFNIKSFIGINGDCYDRYLIRMLEMGESLNIINSVLNYFLNNKINNNLIYQELINKEVKKYQKNYIYMEDLIEHFIQ
jgi:NADH:ubiquinone oxidoreductase subunit D